MPTGSEYLSVQNGDLMTARERTMHEAIEEPPEESAP